MGVGGEESEKNVSWALVVTEVKPRQRDAVLTVGNISDELEYLMVTPLNHHGVTDYQFSAPGWGI